jgi:hypothetical protein
VDKWGGLFYVIVGAERLERLCAILFLRRKQKKLDKDAMADGEDAAAARRRTAITDYRKKLLNCRELESRVGTGESSVPRLPSPLSPLPPPTLLDPNLPRVRSGRFRISLED